MSPFEVVRSIIPLLAEKERQEIRMLLGMGAPSPCQKNGHKLRILSRLEAGWFTPAKVKLYCEKCGYIQIEDER